MSLQNCGYLSFLQPACRSDDQNKKRGDIYKGNEGRMKRSGEGIVENRSDKSEYYRHKVNI